MIEVIGDKLWQWDTGRTVRVTVPQGADIYEVHFHNGTTENALVGVIKTENGEITSEIPNIFLQSSNNITIYSVTVDESGERTEESLTVSVTARPKPDDYVYTETEVLNYTSLNKRLEALENGSGMTAEIKDGILYIDSPGTEGAEIIDGILHIK